LARTAGHRHTWGRWKLIGPPQGRMRVCTSCGTVQRRALSDDGLRPGTRRKTSGRGIVTRTTAVSKPHDGGVVQTPPGSKVSARAAEKVNKLAKDLKLCGRGELSDSQEVALGAFPGLDNLVAHPKDRRQKALWLLPRGQVSPSAWLRVCNDLGPGRVKPGTPAPLVHKASPTQPENKGSPRRRTGRNPDRVLPPSLFVKSKAGTKGARKRRLAKSQHWWESDSTSSGGNSDTTGEGPGRIPTGDGPRSHPRGGIARSGY
jgi:hypothetical protein